MRSEVFLGALLALPFAASLAALCFRRNARNAEAWLAGSVALVCFLLTLALFADGADGSAVRLRLAWLPSSGLEFVLRMDGLAWMFCALISGIGFLVVLYARYYMSPQDPIPRFYSLLLAFMGAMLGTVLSGNLIQIVFFWETTGLLSFLLIGYWHQNAAARDGARMALVITSAGGLCLLGGMLLLGRIAGSYDLDAVLARGDLIRADPHYVPALALIAVGALTKSAQFPFHFWLPQAMAAPTPVSAYLHSATMVKLGVFLLARLWPALSGTEAWIWIVGTAGLATLLLGAYAAIFQHDLKGLLAYSTISHLGLMTVLLGLNSRLALIAALFHVMNHATFKASLFMTAGIIDHETGTRDIRRLNGLRRFMPVTAALATVSAAAMAGVPLLNGFLSKEMFFSETLSVEGPAPSLNRALPYVAVAWGMFSVAYSLRFVHGVFFGPAPRGLERTPAEPPRWMRFPMELLVLACLLVGTLPGLTIGPVLDAAARAVLGEATPPYSLSVWHGFTVPLMMSFAALLGGALLYLPLRKFLALGKETTPLLPPIEGRRVFDAMLVALSWRWARLVQQALATRRLQPQLRWVVVAALVAACWPLLYGRGLEWGPLPLTKADAAFVLLWIAGGACALAAAWQAKFHRLAAVVLVGGAGVVVCVTFVWLGAADLALTQLLVEIVTTVLLLLGLRWLPKRVPFAWTRAGALRALPRRARDLLLAVASGGGIAALAYAMMSRPLPESVSRFYLEQALPGGGGANVVNVIIVDFRGFDTLGEIAVLGVVAITVFALLRRFRPAPESVADRAPPPVSHAEDLRVPGVLMRLMFFVAALFSAHLLLRGHDLPGGGFVAGLALSIGVILLYMAGGTQWAEDRLAIRPLRWISLGLLVAAATGVGSWFSGHAFLTSHTARPRVPLLGEMHLPSAFFFDLGVFALVVGATGAILIALAHQSTRAHRAAPPER